LFSTNTKFSATIRRRIIKFNLMEYKCKICGITEHNNKNLSLHLDHIRYLKSGEILGVSDNAIRKHLIHNKIDPKTIKKKKIWKQKL
jgi:hypothetical protein